MRIGLGLGITNLGGAPAFNPATELSLTGWWRASYAASPWVGTASLGISGTKNLTEATNPPAAGSTLNGYTPAEFDGTNDVLTAAGQINNYMSSAAGAGWALVYLDVNNTNAAGTDSNRMLFSTVGGTAAMGLDFRSSQGARISLYDGAYKSAYKAITTATWALLAWRWNSTTLAIGVNEAPGAAGGASSIACGAILAADGAFKFGQNYYGSIFFDGKVADVGFANTLTDDDLENVKRYINLRYNLAL